MILAVKTFEGPDGAQQRRMRAPFAQDGRVLPTMPSLCPHADGRHLIRFKGPD